MAKKEKRFIVAYEESSFTTWSHVIIDRETGVNYLYYGASTGGGLTPLLDREGKPIITTVFPEE